jgi:hypothetical protein
MKDLKREIPDRGKTIPMFKSRWMASVFMFALLITSCTLNPAVVPTNTPTFTPMWTPTPTVTPTPTPVIPRPTVDSNLSSQNNASMVVENGTWVVKNAEGNVTATWDGTTNKWTYNYDNIKMQVGIAETKYDANLLDGISETGVVNIPQDMLKPLSASQQDPNPVVPSGHYEDFIATTTLGSINEAYIGVDYRGIVYIDNQGFYIQGGVKAVRVDEYAIIFTVQNANHPDVINVLVAILPDEKQDCLHMELTSSGKMNGKFPTYHNFIAMLKGKNPVGRRMRVELQVSAVRIAPTEYYSPDNQAMLNSIDAGTAIPSELNIRLEGASIGAPEDLFK